MSHPGEPSLPAREHGSARRAVWGIIAALLALIAWVHLVHLDAVPRGLYVDESSIGFNAAAIAETGRDEHGVRFPVYFRAFGEYKNPVYIYATALIFKLAGVSVQTLRLTSVLFFPALLGGICCLARKLFPESPVVALWAVAAAGFLPWFFTMPRIAVEVISQPAVPTCTSSSIDCCCRPIRTSRWRCHARGPDPAFASSISTGTPGSPDWRGIEAASGGPDIRRSSAVSIVPRLFRCMRSDVVNEP